MISYTNQLLYNNQNIKKIKDDAKHCSNFIKELHKIKQKSLSKSQKYTLHDKVNKYD